MNKFLALVSVALLAASASAHCDTHAVSGTGSAGGSLTIRFDGSTAGAFVVTVVGQTEGTLPIRLGALGSLTLGITDPALILPIGAADAQGDASLSINNPSNVPSPGAVPLKSEGVSLSYTASLPGGGGPGGGGPGNGGAGNGGGGPSLPSIGFAWCTSNVVTFTIGSWQQLRPRRVVANRVQLVRWTRLVAFPGDRPGASAWWLRARSGPERQSESQALRGRGSGHPGQSESP